MGSALLARVFYCPFVTIWVIWMGHLKLLIEVPSNTGVYRPRAKWVPPTERMGICVDVTRKRARFNILRVILKTETMNSTVHVCRCFAMPSSDIIAKELFLTHILPVMRQISQAIFDQGTIVCEFLTIKSSP